MHCTLTAFDRESGDAIYDLDEQGNATWECVPLSWERANEIKREQEESDRQARLAHKWDCTLVYEIEFHA